MRTFFVTLPRELDVRNFLLGDFYLAAQERPDIRLVVFVPPKRAEQYRAEFGHERCIIEAMVDLAMSRKPLRRFFGLLSYASLPATTIWFRQKIAHLNGGSFLAFWGKNLLWYFGHFSAWRTILRMMDGLFFRDNDLWGPYFEKYKPSAVFAPGLTDESDLTLLRYAKQKGTSALSMPRSWDNFTSKLLLRVFPDLLLVQNPSMVREARRLGYFPEKRIRVVGFPQFDHYLDPAWRMKREELAERFGLDPQKRWVLYFTGGLATSVMGKKDYSDHIEMLLNAIERGDLPYDVEIIARVHPLDQAVLRGKAAHVPILDFGKEFDFRTDDLKLLANMVRESAVTINTGSTMTLEAAIFDRPIVLAAFDGYGEAKLPWHKKLGTALDHTVHYLNLERTGGMVRAADEKELVEKVRTYLENPNLHHGGRRRLREEYVGPLDGGAGRGVFDTMIQL